MSFKNEIEIYFFSCKRVTVISKKNLASVFSEKTKTDRITKQMNYTERRGVPRIHDQWDRFNHSVTNAGEKFILNDSKYVWNFTFVLANFLKKFFTTRRSTRFLNVTSQVQPQSVKTRSFEKSWQITRIKT